MKIAIPMAAGQLCMHFGHCEQFGLFSIDENGAIQDSQFLTPPPHEPGLLPKWLAEKGATVILAGGMGMRAQQLFIQSGIEVCVGVPAGPPEEIVSAYLAGTLTTGENVCDH